MEPPNNHRTPHSVTDRASSLDALNPEDQKTQTIAIHELRTLEKLASHLGVTETELRNVNGIDLTDIHLNEFPLALLELNQMNALYLASCRLTHIPEKIDQLSNLENLWLSQNQIAAVPETIGNLTQLHDLNLHMNKIEQIPASIGKLRSLKGFWLNHNRLASLPDTMRDLNNLIYLDLSSNLFSNIPETLLRLPESCEVNFEFNPVPVDILAAFHAHINSPDYQGPEFNYHVHEENDIDESQPAEEVIAEWGVDPKQLEDLESIKIWLLRLELTSDYENDPDKLKSEIKVYLLWLSQLQDPDIKTQAYLIIRESVATCGDRVSLSRNDLACLKKLSESGDLSLNQLQRLIIGFHRLELVKQRAKDKLKDMKGRDDIQTYLHLMTSLKAKLDLPIETNSLLYEQMSGLSEPEIENFGEEILKATTQKPEIVSVLIASHIWRKRLDKLPEMILVLKDIAEQKERFLREAEGMEEKYFEQFTHFEREEWNPYFVLTQNLVNQT